MAYGPPNTGLTNLSVTKENEDGERGKYLPYDKMTSHCFYLFLCQMKGRKRPLNVKHSESVTLGCYTLSKWPLNRAGDNKYLAGNSEKVTT